MAKPEDIQQEPAKPLNLEALSLDELGRKPFCESGSQEEPEILPSQLQGPHSSKRCHSSERELFKNQFPSDE